MNDLQKEIAELKSFIADLKADRAATKEKEKREAWTKYVSLSVVIIAVIAAIAPSDSVERFTALGAHVILGEARFTGPDAAPDPG